MRGNLLYASSNEDDFRDKSENSSESSSDYIGADCSNPVRCDSLQTERRSFSATNPMALLKRGLTQLSDTDPESCGEVGGEKDHIYYILNASYCFCLLWLFLLIPYTGLAQGRAQHTVGKSYQI